jgi:hypothetical protein
MLFAGKPQPGRSTWYTPLVLLIGLTLIRGLFYLSIFPPFLAPDESAHFEAIRLIGQQHQWPTAEVYQTTPMHPQMDALFEQFRLWTLVGLYSPTRNLGVTDNLFIHYYPTQIAGSEVVADSYLMLYHVIVAPVSALFAPFDLATQVYILRVISVLFATLTVAVAWFTIQTIFPGKRLFALGAVSFIVFWPMHTHVTASINADGLAELIAALFFFILVKAWRNGFSFYKWLLLVGLLVVGMLTKPTMFFLLPTFVAVLIIYAGRRLMWTNRAVGGLISSLFIATWIGAIFLYENSNGGRRLLAIFSEGINLPEWTGYFTPAALKFYVGSLNFAVLSFGGLFGWSNIHIPWTWVKVWALILGIILVGVLLYVVQNLLEIGSRREHLNHYQKEILVIFLLAVGFCLMGVTLPIVITQSPSWGIHSRYYFPAIIPIALYLFLGTYQLMSNRLAKFLWPCWLLFWFGYDLIVLIFVLIPYLYS